MKKQILISLVVLTVVTGGLVYMVVATNPDQVGPVGITSFFALLYIGFFILLGNPRQNEIGTLISDGPI